MENKTLELLTKFSELVYRKKSVKLTFSYEPSLLRYEVTHIDTREVSLKYIYKFLNNYFRGTLDIERYSYTTSKLLLRDGFKDRLIKVVSELESSLEEETSNGITIGEAINAMKQGKLVTRASWNDKNIFIYYVPSNSYPMNRNLLKTMDGMYEDNLVPYQEYIAMKTVDDTVVPWSVSQSDILADDYYIVG